MGMGLQSRLGVSAGALSRETGTRLQVFGIFARMNRWERYVMNRNIPTQDSTNRVYAKMARAWPAKGQCPSMSVRDQFRKSALRARGKCIAGYSPPAFAA
jgi:hypothetical protein